METVELKVEGMDCQGCVKSVTRMLSGVAGVETVDVSLEKARARHLRSGEGRAGGVQARHRARRIQGAVKDSLKAELATRREVTVDENRCIGFMGKEGMVYATPRMGSDVEYTCRDFLLEHLDAGEDSVGAHVSIDHLAATPLGLKVTIDVKIVEVDRRRVTFEFSVQDPIEQCGRGRHVRFVVETAKSRERLAAKRAKAGLK